MQIKLSGKKKLKNMLFVSFLIIVGLVVRVGFIQLIQGGELSSMAYQQQTLDRNINPKRGVIYDTTGKNILAVSSTVETVSVNPGNISKKDKEKVAKVLSDIFELDYEQVLKKVSKRSSIETIIKKVDKEKTDKLRVWMEENNIDTGGNGRFNIWNETLKIVKDNWLIGIGYDNLYLAYPNPKVEESIGFSITEEGIKRTTPTSITVVDAAHNIYLHTLATSGIIGLIPYLIICLLTFIRGLKSKNKLIFMLLAGFVAYSIQGFANISIIQVAPIYYFIIGLMLIKYDGRKYDL